MHILGCLASTTALTRPSVGPIPFADTSYPKNATSVRPILHFSQFSVRFTAFILSNTWFTRLSCVSLSAACTTMLSEILVAPSIPANAEANFVLEYFTCRVDTKQQFLVEIQNMQSVWQMLLCHGIWVPTPAGGTPCSGLALRIPWTHSTLAGLHRLLGSGDVLELSLNSFVLRISMHSLMSRFGLGAITVGLTHGVGPATGSMISNSTNCFSFPSTRSRSWNAVRCNGWATGVTLGSTFNVNCVSFILPGPVNTSGNSWRNCSA